MIPDKPNGATVITLRAMKFDALIGILPHESEKRQPVEVDLTLHVTPPSGKIGTHNILDYRHAYDVVASVITAGHIDYLEEAADSIASKALELPLVESVAVAVRKMNVELGGPLEFAEVKVERSRG